MQTTGLITRRKPTEDENNAFDQGKTVVVLTVGQKRYKIIEVYLRSPHPQYYIVRYDVNDEVLTSDAFNLAAALIALTSIQIGLSV